ncbi:imidazolonepropionase [Bdellovibrio sp. qaytius]|nr:imidazolonepropionase [Bdellovibrio sp. qaytius]
MAMIIENGLISWIGPQGKIPKKIKFKKTIDLKNKKVMPAFIECHTHSVFAGSRADEFELRNTGSSYLEIAKKGGGILSTMRKTRKATPKDLLASTQERVNNFIKQGVATVEIKSGYALDLKNEIKTLEVIHKIKTARVIPTFLGAHAKPPEYDSYGQYLEFLATKVLPIVKKKKLSNRVDIFIEKNFFEVAESRTYLAAAKKLGFEVTIHANQLSLSGGAELALELQAQSADHVINLSDDTIQYFAKSKTVAVLLPAADLYMKCAYPPARALIDSGATVALATDYNPGTCPTQDLSLVGLLARLEMKMTLSEVFKAYTINAAKALGIDREEGSLSVGKRANFISTDAELTDFFYSAGAMPSHQLFILGKLTKVE